METATAKTAAQTAAQFIQNTRQHVFLTGKAGTGKTTFLRNLIKSTHKNVVVAAPTGIAAINAGGVTLHSLFNLPFGVFVPNQQYVPDPRLNVKVTTPYSLIKEMQMNERKRKMFREMDLLVIDEVSMLRADLLDAIDTVLRYARRNQHQSFGGAQVLFIGDLMQLPPVVKDEDWRVLEHYYPSAYFFDAKVMRENKPVYVELDKIYRQSDPEFVDLLNHLRDNELTPEDILLLNRHYKPDFEAPEGAGYIQLTTHNNKADQHNKTELQKLRTKSFFYQATIEGDFPEFSYPLEKTLEFKQGAQVMFVKNDMSGKQKYFNGKIGTISELKADYIEVSFPDGSAKVEVERYTWENKRYSLNESTNEIEEQIIGKFIHYPLKLAWSITVHKSQGLTFEKAILDVAAAFAPGQMYVALSRLTSLKGLVLTSPIRNTRLLRDDSVGQFAASKEKQEILEARYEQESHGYFKEFLLSAFDFSSLTTAMQAHLEGYTKDELRSEKQKHLEWMRGTQTNLLQLKIVADKFLGQLLFIFESPKADYLTKLYERVLAAKDYFEPSFTTFSKNLLALYSKLQEQSKVKGYLDELQELERQFFKQWQLITKAQLLLKARVENIEWTKESLGDPTSLEARKQQVEKNVKAVSYTYKKKEPKEKTPKKEKGHSRELSYTLYKEGKTVEEIATERSLSATTIEGHLAQCVGIGQLPVTDFMELKKVEEILLGMKDMETKSLTEIKEALNDAYSFSEIRFAVAHQVFVKGEEE